MGHSGVITREMAQHVIDTIKPTVHHNVNIMDAHGVIIAAVDPARVGTHHAGALRAVQVGASVIIRQRDDSSGVRPGVNIPLWHDGAIRGVVGLTGSPDEVQSIAQVIALTVELLLAQERQLDDDVRREAVARDLLAALSSGATADEVLQAELMGVVVHKPWRISVSLAADPHGRAQVPPGGAQWVRHYNRRPGIVAAELYGAIWMVCSGTPPTIPDSRTMASRPTESIAELRANAVMLRHACAYPGLFVGPDGDHHCGGYWQWTLAAAIAYMPHGHLERLADTVRSLTIEQCRTVLALAHHPSAHATASGLYIHRNTLAQRLDQVLARTSLDPRVGGDVAELLMGIYARAALGEMHIFGTQ